MDFVKDGDGAVPEFPTRISLARLLIELDMFEAALEVLERLVNEDDSSVEAWYLGGWCLYLWGARRREQGEEGEGREWLGEAMRVCEGVGYQDEKLRGHAGSCWQRLGGTKEGRR